MIRFTPDTWTDAVLRPLAMAAPNGWVYVESLAPDFRFALALGLALAALISVLLRRGRGERWVPVLALFALVLASFVVWMATTGNGRYFLPYLILIGPLCIGLISLIACTRTMKALIVIIVLSLQGFALFQNNPWRPVDTMAWGEWKEPPYLSMDPDPASLEPQTTYITVSLNSMSLVAPLFPPASRWVNLATFNGFAGLEESKDYPPIRAILESSTNLMLLIRSQPAAMTKGDLQPTQTAIAEINSFLQSHRLAIAKPEVCRFFKSKSLVDTKVTLSGISVEEHQRLRDLSGFWLCPLQYPVAAPAATVLTDQDARAKMAFEKIESSCPRFFPPGQQLVSPHRDGKRRSYQGTDFMLVVTRDDHVYLKYERALNPQLIGSVSQVLQDGFKMDCEKLKGRAGLPWEREI